MNLLSLDILYRLVQCCITALTLTIDDHMMKFFWLFFQEAMMKDTLERAREPNLNLKSFLQNAYIHPVFKGVEDGESDPAVEEFEEEPVLIPTKRKSRTNTPFPSKHSGSSSP